MKYTEVCGHTMNSVQGLKSTTLNLELAVRSEGAPIIVFQDWDGEESKDLFALHLHDAIKLKSIIDSLILNATLFDFGYMKELMEKPLNMLGE